MVYAEDGAVSAKNQIALGETFDALALRQVSRYHSYAIGQAGERIKRSHKDDGSETMLWTLMHIGSFVRLSLAI